MRKEGRKKERKKEERGEVRNSSEIKEGAKEKK